MSKEKQIVIGGPKILPNRFSAQGLLDKIKPGLAEKVQVISQPTPPNGAISILYWLSVRKIIISADQQKNQEEASRWQDGYPLYHFIIGRNDDPDKTAWPRWQDIVRLELILKDLLSTEEDLRKEKLIKTDSSGLDLETISRHEAHNSSDRPTHLCVTCFIVNPYGQIAIGQRSLFKKLNSGLFQAFPSGHVNSGDFRSGEVSMDNLNSALRAAISREMYEESHIGNVHNSRKSYLPDLIHVSKPCFVETDRQREIFYAYILPINRCMEAEFCPGAEFRDVFWVDYKDLLNQINKSPHLFRAGFSDIFSHVRADLERVIERLS